MNDWPDKIPEELDEELSALVETSDRSNQLLYELFTNWSSKNEYGYKGTDTVPLNEGQLRRMVVAQGVVNDVLKESNPQDSLYDLMDSIKSGYKTRLDTMNIDVGLKKRGKDG